MAAVSAEVAVAATDTVKTAAAAPGAGTARRIGGIVLAACALPGVMLPAARAEEAPEKAVLAIKLSGYQEFQDRSGSTTSSTSSTSTVQAQAVSSNGTVSAASGGGSSSSSSGTTSSASSSIQRIRVISPSVYGLVPLGRQWAVEGSLTVDDVSGASPAYYTDTAGFTHMKDRRRAGDLKLTRYFERQSVALGASRSVESDYVSNAMSLEGRFASDDQNTTWNVGLGLTRDTINPSTLVVSNAAKRTREFQLGVTQAISRHDLVQLSVTRSLSSGYLDDPYKSYDHRPNLRNASILQARWNHWLGDAALKTGYRYYQDTFGIRAHTVDLGVALPFGRSGAIFTPELRYYVQNAASFYVDPNTASSTYPAPADQSGWYSLDQRLSAFGAVTLGGKIEWRLDRDWSMDTKLDYYRQATNLRPGGGSPGLAALNAFIWQIGLKREF